MVANMFIDGKAQEEREGGTQPILCRSLESPSMAQADITVQPIAVMLGFLMALPKAFGLQVKGQPASISASVSLSDMPRPI